jgi:hypothetical protein
VFEIIITFDDKYALIVCEIHSTCKLLLFVEKTELLFKKIYFAIEKKKIYLNYKINNKINIFVRYKYKINK